MRHFNSHQHRQDMALLLWYLSFLENKYVIISSGVVKIAIYSTVLTKFTKNKLSSERPYNSLSSKHYQKSLCHSKVGQQISNFLDSTCVIFNVAEVSWVLTNNAWIQRENQTSESLFYVQCFDYCISRNFSESKI